MKQKRYGLSGAIRPAPHILSTFLLCALGLFPVIAQSWVPLGPEGGRMEAMVQDPSNADHFYTASGRSPGGIYKSTDGGSTWQGSGSTGSYTSDMAASGNRIYACRSSRIYYSTNGGSTWNFYYHTNHGFYGLAADPANTNHLHAYGKHYTGSEYQLAYYKSTNKGETWTVHTIDDSWSYAYPYGFAVDPTNTDRIYIVGYGDSGSSYTGWIYMSDNGGATWTPIMPAGETSYCYDVEVNSSGKVFFCTYSKCYYSTSQGASWDYSWNGGYNLRTHPADDNLVYVAGYEVVRKSTDGGSSFTSHTSGLYGGSPSYFLIDRSNSSHLFYTNSIGIFRSTDGGMHWQEANSGLVLAQITALALDASSPSTLFASFANNAVYKTTNATGKPFSPLSVTWERLPVFYSCTEVAAFCCQPGKILAMEGGT